MTDTTPVRRTPVTDRSAWKRADVERDQSWLIQLTPADLTEIDAAIAGLRKNRRTLDTITRDDFPFPEFSVTLARMLWGEVALGRGFAVLRGLPAERYSEDELGMLFWGIGMHLGTGVSQNAAGDKLGHVRDVGIDYHALNARGYQTSSHLKFHTDSSDVVGLLCARPAKEGGLSSVASATTVFNTILAEHPEYLPVLFGGFEFDRRGEATPFQADVSERRPIFADVGGDLSMRYVPGAIRTARKKLGNPLTELEQAALDCIDEIAAREDVCYSMMLKAGDMQFCSNYTGLHSRTEYADHEDPALKRHMLRLWLQIHGFRRLDPVMLDSDAESGWSRRWGVLPRGTTMRRGVLEKVA